MKGNPEIRREVRRIVRKGYVADIITSHSKVLDSTLFHYIVQLEGSPEVLHWGQETTMQRAYDCVNEFIDYKRRKNV